MADAAAAANKKKTYIIAGAAALVLILLVVFLVSRGKRTGGGAEDDAPKTGLALARRGGGRSRARERAEERGLVDTAGTATTGEAKEIKPEIYPGEAEPIREDPFVVKKPPPPPPLPPPPPVLPAVTPMAGGIRVAGPATLTSLRRTAGIMWNGEVYGLLQLGTETYIVRPGDTVREYTVNAITRDSIVLYSPTIRRQIQVPLQGPSSRLPEQFVSGGPSAEVYALDDETLLDSSMEDMEEVPEFEETLEWTEEEIIPALPELPPE